MWGVFGGFWGEERVGFSNSKATAPGTNVCGKNGGGKGGKVLGKAKSRSSRVDASKTSAPKNLFS